MAASSVTLASGSAIRATLLRNAGLVFDIYPPNVDEGAIKKTSAAQGLSLGETALALAEAKALAVSSNNNPVHRQALIIGADQILEFDGAPYDKPACLDEARRRLFQMQGKTHRLINAVVVARAGQIIWRNLEIPSLTMRDLNEEEIDRYLQDAGDDILSSVGAYQIEHFGARLFEKIEGDYFAVLGLSLFPLFKVLRQEGALAF